MKSFSKLLILFSLLAGACSNELKETQEHSDEVESIHVTLDDLKCEDGFLSRTTITLESDGPHYAWAETDTIGIFPSVGRQVEFSMAGGAGTQSATFTGGGWGLKKTSTYAAYCPLIGSYYLDKTQIPMDYSGQVQDGDTPLLHLGGYDYLMAPTSEVKDGGVSFNFVRLGALARILMTVPAAASFQTLVLKCDDALFVKEARINLKNGTCAPHTYTDRLELDLGDMCTTEAGQQLVCYLMMYPVDMTGKSVYVVLQDTDSNCYQGTIESKNMTAGLAYAFSSTLKEVSLASSVLAPSLGTVETEI